MAEEKSFSIPEMLATLTLLEMWARSARENLVMKIEFEMAAEQSSNLVEADGDVLRRIQNGNQATVKAAPADRARAMAEAHGEQFDAALKNVLGASGRLHAMLA